MRKRRHRCTGRWDWFAVFAVAFGAGLFLALFCSLKFALFLAAIALVYLGITCRL